MIPLLIAGTASTALIVNAVGIGKPSTIPLIPYQSFHSSEVLTGLQNPQNQNFLKITKTDQVVASTKDPIWSVELVVEGKVVDKVDALIGRSYRQNANRHIAGNESPLPKGNYRVDREGIVKERFDNPELGKGYWVPITPLFSTGRSALGFHQDPSWGLLNKESGTSGCIGLRSPEDTRKVVDWIRQYNIETVDVQS